MNNIIGRRLCVLLCHYVLLKKKVQNNIKRREENKVFYNILDMDKMYKAIIK